MVLVGAGLVEGGPASVVLNVGRHTFYLQEVLCHGLQTSGQRYKHDFVKGYKLHHVRKNVNYTQRHENYIRNGNYVRGFVNSTRRNENYIRRDEDYIRRDENYIRRGLNDLMTTLVCTSHLGELYIVTHSSCAI